MAIVHPQRAPGWWSRQRFEIERVDHLSPENGGRIGAVTAGFPVWTASWDLGRVGPDRADEVAAFVDSLNGAQIPFLAWDVSRPWPKAHPAGFGGMVRAGGGAFDGTAATWAADSSRQQLTLTGLPANLALSVRDYVGFAWETEGEARRALVRTLESARADADGALTVEVRPALPTLIPPEAVATLKRPDCLMRLTPETEIGDMDRRRQVRVRIVARQDLME